MWKALFLHLYIQEICRNAIITVFAKPEFHACLILSPRSHNGLIYQNELKMKSQALYFRTEGHKSRYTE